MGISNCRQWVIIIVVGQDWTTPWKWDAWGRVLDKVGVSWNGFAFTDFLRDSLLDIWQRRLQWGPDIVRINRDLVRWTKENRPKVVFIWNGLPVWPETVKQIQKWSWVTCYTNDNPFGDFAKWRLWRHFRSAIPCYDSHHVYRESNIVAYKNQYSVERVRLLRSYAVPWLHFPDPDDSIPVYDVVFVGHCEPDRARYTKWLVESGIQVRVFGPLKTWKKYCDFELLQKIGPVHELDVKDYRKVLSRARICLGYLSEGNCDTYTRRCFEVPACGGFLVCERTDHLQRLYQEGFEAEFFDSERELLHKIRYYLDHPQARKKIASAGQRRYVKSGYDVVSVVKQWIKDIEDFSGTQLLRDV